MYYFVDLLVFWDFQIRLWNDSIKFFTLKEFYPFILNIQTDTLMLSILKENFGRERNYCVFCMCNSLREDWDYIYSELRGSPTVTKLMTKQKPLIDSYYLI